MKSISSIPARVPPAATSGPGTGVRDGAGAARADGWRNEDVSTFGGLPAAAQKLDPQGGPCVPYGPSSGAWSKSGRATTKPKG
jgi:hypothetical protein